ncbi:hypothetical protein A2642_00315 [Candidatus Nomurabacteria bacterium RIFCSPHIGHO2_01_FULL_39_10]|uniref:N-acetyltransferase domain-containing protein n=1 Tax=Candidatus Nomurabacteria bacterium RIFCSPHIGHO2_01_FULL_39_10 TaxID=1801733 RepID=A0A1F6V3A6_9BACT|nr:MAG: hypothetical protein A2642_00315 [Candidatus Nomurabacteria bacterium RIFCSPHIGHO2_01_FULL_39_10]
MLYIKEATDVPKQQYALLAQLLNTAWKELIVTTPEHLESRFASGNKFLIVYGNSAFVDKENLAQEYGIALPNEDIPLGLLETITLRTNGVMDQVPKTYGELTNNGLWKLLVENADTLIMVDATKMPTGPKEVTGLMMNSVKEYLCQTSLEYAWTFTPDIEGVKKWHESFGAKNSHYRIPNARPNWKEPAVNFMDYSHLIKK